ncbi:TadE family protein [Lignipirellula cremea]|uniref:TadE-like protein n=1 Tax=Lignipirellula cremea TaxID=2528010 RepID=A0A518E429_9BACT|nr:TadE family protein [Lignipirellula cremea]QDU98838.1 TadE-like protein [Lignipirellula cremea]
MKESHQHQRPAVRPCATPSSRRRRSQMRRGQSLVEFALVSLVVYMLLAAILTFGHMLYVAQGVQQAADLAAREISRTPLPAEILLDDVLHGDASADSSLANVRSQIYDEHYLVLNLDTFHGRGSLAELVADLPLVNQQLVPLMISDQINGVNVLRYPGAIFTDGHTGNDPSDPPPSGFLVAIPLVNSRDGTGVETIAWVPVVEAIDSEASRLSSDQRGVVALRINYPFQSASMSSFRPNPDGPFEPNLANPNVANDAGVKVAPGGYQPSGTAIASDRDYGPYTGTYGLGAQAALGSQQLTGGLPVRPFRRVISAQAIYRRELFTP